MSPFRIVVTFVFFAIAGIGAMSRLTLDLRPTSSAHKITVTYTLPDAPPEVVEQEATAPLENALATIPNIERIYSISNSNKGLIEITFDESADQNLKRFEVISSIRRVYPKLTNRLTYPNIEQRARDQLARKPLLLYHIYSSRLPSHLQQTVKEIYKNRISQHPMVDRVEVQGAGGRRIKVTCNSQMMLAQHTMPADIGITLRQAFDPNYLGYSTNQAGKKLAIARRNEVTDLKGIADLPLFSKINTRIGDLAAILMEEAPPNQYFRVNGENAVTLAIYADEENNWLNLSNDLKQLVNEISYSLPADCYIKLFHDESALLTIEVNGFLKQISLCLAVITLAVFLLYKPKRSIVLISSVLVSGCLTALLVFIFRLKVDLIGLGAMTVSFGISINTAIIILHNLTHPAWKRVRASLALGGFATIMFLFAGFAMLNDNTYDFIDFFSIVILATVSSTVVAVYFVPAACSMFDTDDGCKQRKPIKYRRRKIRMIRGYRCIIFFLQRIRFIFVTALILSFGLPIFLLPGEIDGLSVYNRTIGNDFYQREIKPHIARVLGGSLRVFLENSAFHTEEMKHEETRLYIYAQLPSGNTIEDMNLMITKVEEFLLGASGVDQIVTNIQSGQFASISVMFEPGFKNSSIPYQLKNKVLALVLNWTGASWNIFGVGKAFSNQMTEGLSSFRVRIKGYNLNTLAEQAERFTAALSSNKRVQSVNMNERLEWREKSTQYLILKPRTNALENADISYADLTSSIYGRSGDDDGLRLQLGDDIFPVVVVSDRSPHLPLPLHEIINSAVETDNRNFRVGDFAFASLEQTANAIHKENREYIRVIGFDYYGSKAFGSAFVDRTIGQMEQELPLGYTIENMSPNWDFKSVAWQMMPFLIALLVTYLTLLITFNNLIFPLIIVCLFPVSLVGVFLSFGLLERDFGYGGVASLVLMASIILYHTVVLTRDFSMDSRQLTSLSIKTIMRNLGPFLLANISLLIAILPVLMSSDDVSFWYEFALGTFAGFFSFCFALTICLPVFYFKKTTNIE